MAPKKQTADGAAISPLSNEEMQSSILQVELQTKMIQLKQAERANMDFEQHEELRHKQNKERQVDMSKSISNRLRGQKSCRHMSGGKPGKISKGGGIGSFSIITQAMMPDGVTILLQCARCRLKVSTPSQELKKRDPMRYLADLEYFNELLEKSEDSGLSALRGPTFMFKNERGVPFLPEFNAGVSIGR